MKKKINKILKLILVTIIISLQLLLPISIGALTEEDVKQTAKKGDIYNPQTNTIGNNAIINDHNYAHDNIYSSGDVEVQKRVEKINKDGKYNVSFWVRGKETTSTKTKDTYIVFVIDRSFTMGDNNRWKNAKQAVIDISTELSKVEGIKMALVGFSGGKASSQTAYDDTVTLRGTFSSNKFTETEFGNYDTDSYYNGGTNIQAGLLKANELLSTKTGTKYVILLSDGVPTFYYKSDGYTDGPGNSDTAEKISKVPECKNKAIQEANTLKNNGVTIYTVGYELDALTNKFTYNNVYYNEKDIAILTLKGIASTNSHYYQADSDSSDNIAKALIEIQTEITTFPAGYHPIIEDKIGNNFLLETNTQYGGSITLDTSSDFKITESWQKIGEFDINIDQSLDTGWYQTNIDFTLTYELSSGQEKQIICTDNPEVFWNQDIYDYIVNYYYTDLKGNYNSIDHNKTIKNIKYGTIITTSNHYLKDNEIKKGYLLDEIKTTAENETTYTINKRGTIIDIYYKRNSYNYQVNYYFNNKIETSLTLSKQADYKDTIYAQNYYLEKINKEAISLKNKTDHTNYFLDPNHSSNNSNIVIDTDENVINIYYIDTQFEDERISKDSSIEKITNSNTKIPYTIQYSVDVSNVKKGDIITTTITDYLPTKIDINNQNTNLNGGVYNQDTDTITWIFTEKMNDYQQTYTINKEMTYSVVYKDIANISSKIDNDLTNTATVVTKIEEKSTEGVIDTEKVEVEIKGKVITIYVEEGNEENKLAPDEFSIGLVGDNYTTQEKSITGYTLIEEKLPLNKEGKYQEQDIIVKYVYKKKIEDFIIKTDYPLPPHTGLE